MVKQVAAVLQSYGQRCRSLVTGALVAGGLLQVLVILCVAPHAKWVNTLLPFIAMGMVFLGMHLWLQLRLHLLTSRRFTWPGYVAPQLAVFFLFAILLVVGWPAAITLLNGHGGIGLVAMALGMFALIGWCIVTLSMTLVIVCTAGYLWLCFGSITSQHTLLLDSNPAAGALVLIASVVLITMAVYRLTRIDEETPNYRKRLSVQGPDVLPKMTGQQADPRGKLSRLQLLFTPSIEKFLPRPGNTWDRTRRWRYLRQSTLWFPAVLASGAFLPQLLIQHSFASQRSVSSTFIPNPVLWMYLFMSGSFVASAWLQSWRYLDLEFVRPVPRRMLLKDLGLGMTIQTLQTWLIMASIVVCVWLSNDRLNYRLDSLAELLSVAFASQLLGLVVAFLVMPFRSPGGVMLAHLGAVFLGGGGILGACFGLSDAASWIATIGSVALLLSAAALLPIAIRRWDVTDLG